MRTEKLYWVYILTNKTHSVLYTGVTGNLPKRLFEHQSNRGSTFTQKYHVHKLVFAESFPTPLEAIAAEKKIKGGSRLKKIKLIESLNPQWEEIIL
ncbi:MAG: GIY-YIG nuclease family protein [Candidatus Moranbacteria bacterium]|nr:GIY-YIG nuclease family protein [Candidatus Moranbacteria bacterium]